MFRSMTLTFVSVAVAFSVGGCSGRSPSGTLPAATTEFSALRNVSVTGSARLLYVGDGDANAVFVFNAAKIASGLWPGSTSVVIPGDGHFPHEGKPDRVVEAIRAWATTGFARS